ncbi:MAG: hypothetical protein J5927_04505 [Oscillospiraceae bacterium]|nr:hypothetical protein [Oscillospiraceae bacterium]
MLGIIGIILAIALFIFMAFKGVNLLVSAITATLVMILFNFPIASLYKVLAGTYVAKEGAAATGFMTYMAGFIKSYFFLFVLSSLLGRIMADGGAARRIALACSTLVDKASDSNKKFVCALLVPLLYAILSFVGISGFVIVFTVMPIAKDLFEKTDTPWAFYCFGGPQAVGVTALAASLQAGNIYAANVCGTTTTAAPVLSIVSYAAWIVATLLVIKIMMKKAVARGETFLTDGAAVKAAAASAQMADEDLPNIWLSIIPLLFVIVLSAGFKVEVVPALFFGCVLAAIFFWKNLKKVWKSTLANGVTSCFGSVFTVAATYAMGSVIRICPSFAIIQSALNALPGLIGGSILMLVMSFAMASSSSTIAAFGSNILESFTGAGLSNAVAHRLMTIEGFTCMAPHNPGIANAMTVTKIAYKRCLKMYMAATFIPGLAAFIVAIILLAVGVRV